MSLLVIFMGTASVLWSVALTLPLTNVSQTGRIGSCQRAESGWRAALTCWNRTNLCHPETVRVAAAHQAEAEKIAAELAAIASSGMILPGSITERRTRCGRSNCACHADPPRLHGPYW
jgi:hypothetical protein